MCCHLLYKFALFSWKTKTLPKPRQVIYSQLPLCICQLGIPGVRFNSLPMLSGAIVKSSSYHHIRQLFQKESFKQRKEIHKESIFLLKFKGTIPLANTWSKAILKVLFYIKSKSCSVCGCPDMWTIVSNVVRLVLCTMIMLTSVWSTNLIGKGHLTYLSLRG